MIDLLILGAIALFVLGRLYMALGSDNGPPDNRSRGRSEPSPVRRDGLGGDAARPARDQVRPETIGRPTFTGPAAGGLEEIHNADRSFHPGEFVTGAKAAYEIIVNAFADGDLDTLKPLLDDEVYETWAAAVAARTEEGPQPPTLLRLRSAVIDEAELRSNIASVDVLFDAELGDGDRVRIAKEIWTFEKPVDSGDPNWKLTAVSTPD